MRRLALAVLTVLALVLALPDPPAEAAACPAPGGQPISRSNTLESGADFTFTGGGWGHGVGMSQYGAHGAGQLGCTYREILTTYYQGTTVGSVTPVPSSLRVSLLPGSPGGPRPTPSESVDVRAVSGGVPWIMHTASGTITLPAQPAERVYRVRVRADGRLTVRDLSTGADILQWTAGRLEVRLAGRIVAVPRKSRQYLRGSLWFESVPDGSSSRMILAAAVPFEQYLYGLAEMPSSFHAEALKAQAVAGRSFALRRYNETGGSLRADCRCHLYDSVAHQVYGGRSHETTAWLAAVNGTANQFVRSGSAVAETNYSSSSGGHTEAAVDWTGSNVSYLQAIDDSRWERASGNPNSTWRVSFSAAALGQRVGVGVATSVRTPNPRTASGRVGNPPQAGGLVVEGTQGTRTLSGPQARTALGLRSTLFAVAQRPAAPPPPPPGPSVPVMGDWNGDGVSTPGWFSSGRWVLRDSNSAGAHDRFLTYGRAGDTPVVGDWNGDGRDGVGVRRGIRWYLRNSLSTAPGTDYWLDYGRATDIPVVGNWTGTGNDGIGVHRDGRWFLRNSLANVPQTTYQLDYGRAGDTPVVGDWTGNGRDGVGVRRGIRWFLRNSLADIPQTSYWLDYGRAADTPVTGNWTGTGTDGVGVVRTTTWYLRNSLRNEPQTSYSFRYGP